MAQIDITSPIANVDSLDVVGERKDGGVDLVVSCSGPLDDSDTTIQRLQTKLRGYIDAANHPNFPKVYPAAARGPTRIFISCAFEVSSQATSAIADARDMASNHGIEILLVPAMGVIQ